MLAQMPDSGNPREWQRQEAPYQHRFQRCPHCNDFVFVMRDRMNGKRELIDAQFNAFGDVLINITRGTFEHLTPDERRIHGGWIHTLHRNVCRNVDAWYQGR